ncbi:hypothetical protein FPRO03_13908 [Fusarium proliferatum]|nr:hypothetical protein FPRO03_13908 [Fusarium proliferatum]
MKWFAIAMVPASALSLAIAPALNTEKKGGAIAKPSLPPTVDDTATRSAWVSSYSYTEGSFEWDIPEHWLPTGPTYMDIEALDNGYHAHLMGNCRTFAVGAIISPNHTCYLSGPRPRFRDIRQPLSMTTVIVSIHHIYSLAMSPDPRDETVSLAVLDRYSDSDEYQTQSAQSDFGLIQSTVLFKLSLQLFLSFMLGSILSSTLTFQIIGKLGCLKSEAHCGPGVLQYSPVIKETDARCSTIYFNGSFMNENVYRRTGSPEVDASWDSLGIDCKTTALLKVWRRLEAPFADTEDQTELLSSLRRKARRVGSQNTMYSEPNFTGAASLSTWRDYTIYTVWKSLYFNYDYYLAIKDESLKGNPDIVRFHDTHCLDTLRQLVMCHAETGVLGQLWVRQSNNKSPQAFPDFNTRHICKDYEKIRKWAKKHQVPPNQEIPTGYVAAPEEPHVLPSIP